MDLVFIVAGALSAVLIAAMILACERLGERS